MDYEHISEFTVSDFDKLKAETLSGNEAGKVVCDTSWYLVTKVSYDEARELYAGESVKIILPLLGSQKLSATITAVNTDSSKNETLIVLNCTNMNSDLSSIRNQKIQIVVDTHTGLRVNSKAVRINDGKKGVYVKLGNLIKFREIDVIYSTKEYVIVDSDNEDGQLKVYDDVIIKGKDLKANG